MQVTLTASYGCLPIVYDCLRVTASSNRSIVVVVSPLKALMLDQVCASSAKGLESAYISAEDEGRETSERVETSPGPENILALVQPSFLGDQLHDGACQEKL